MGYWPEGKSDTPENQMMWGDGPADIIDDAIWQIKIDFLRDLGRMPSKSEIINGIKFSTNVLDDLADEPKDAPVTTEAQDKTIHMHGYHATGGDVGPTESILRSRAKVNDVLRFLSVEPEPAPPPERKPYLRILGLDKI